MELEDIASHTNDENKGGKRVQGFHITDCLFVYNIR